MRFRRCLAKQELTKPSLSLANQRVTDSDDLATSRRASNWQKHTLSLHARRMNGPSGLKCEDYAVPRTNWASLPFVVTCGDSRVRSLGQFRSIGLKDTVKALINEGPPGGMLSRFTLLFDEKAAATDVAADAAMLELGW